MSYIKSTRFCLCLLFLLCGIGNLVYGNSSGGKNIEEHSKISSSDHGIQTLFSEILNNTLPKEKVYLHLDNTSYYHDDTLWFSAYLVNSDGNTKDAVSNTLYVDLLNPGGDIIGTRVLKIVDGRAHGNFKIDCTPFYSGFFEIRAYTKYMMNFGQETAYSRVIPVFDKPRKDGDYKTRNMHAFGAGQYQYKRKFPEKGKDVDVRFYPESGRLVKGIPTRVAFEAKDKSGFPIELQGVVLSSNQDTLVSFGTMHEGKGVFSIVPDGKPMKAMVRSNGRTKTVDLPETVAEGYSISVDNISSRDSVYVTVNRGGIYNRLDTVGVALTGHGIMKVYTAFASSFRKPATVSFSKRDLSTGVAEATLIDINGRRIAERIFFNISDTARYIDMRYEFDKKDYRPYEAVNMTVSLSDRNGQAVRAPFSMSVRDRDNETSWKRNIITDLLLMSDIKGYISNPQYYFESDDDVHRGNLDLLMMVQGWRKYPREILSEKRGDNLRFKPEREGIGIDGIVKSMSNKLMSDVDVTAFLMDDDVEDKSMPVMDIVRTDSLGKFSFVTNVEDYRPLILNTARNNKLIHSQILLDKEYIPSPRKYNIFEMDATLSSDQEVFSAGSQLMSCPLMKKWLMRIHWNSYVRPTINLFGLMKLR